MAEYHISIRRTASTAAYESVSVEVQETVDLEADDGDEEAKLLDVEYKRLSARVEKYVGHELRKYKKNDDSKTVR